VGHPSPETPSLTELQIESELPILNDCDGTHIFPFTGFNTMSENPECSKME
jgi:hypothetical protein